MTGTTVDCTIKKVYASMLGNATMGEVMNRSIQKSGPPAFDDADQAFAQSMQDTLTPVDLAAQARFLGLGRGQDVPQLHKAVLPPMPASKVVLGSSDVCDVSWHVPLAQCFSACYALGTPFHSWQIVAQGKSSVAHKGMIRAALYMADAGLELVETPEVLAEAKQEHAQALQNRPFKSMLPEDAKPVAIGFFE